MTRKLRFLPSEQTETAMDLFYLGLALAFFIVTALLVHACERLRGDS